ncbi:RWD domain-containing protein 1 isoform X3 [Brachypodium distachyon]|uniref:RWD domain-containing protein 1 isoform X3 n=1 Tax=Brachypodium distachyon TaxID=15368 RepID=UPI000D0D51C5|nr:RWD domain-containing protein 1 isoform X3 [Brachypodium distachyon]|eukprot:XP_024315812.1 RWD domain-containing protein 1 isoform X3 [Brachypodium distachyon]
MADYEQEQEMEMEALQAILMDDIKEIDPSESGIDTTSRCFEILLSPQDDDFDEAAHVPVQMALIFAHTEKYPDEPPLVNVKSVRGIKPEDLTSLKEKLDQEVIIPHGEAVTKESFTAWRERFEAELALQRAKLMPESSLTAPKEKKLTGRQYFESGRHMMKGSSTLAEEDEEEEEEDIELDDFEDDEEDMLEHFLAEQTGKSSA